MEDEETSCETEVQYAYFREIRRLECDELIIVHRNDDGDIMTLEITDKGRVALARHILAGQT